jgi:hypothetical protein
MAAAAIPTPPPVAEAGAAVPPAAPAAPSPQYTPPPAPMPQMAEGGETTGGRSSGIKEFFSDINVVDVTVSAFIVAAVLYSIQYHRYMMMLEKTGYADLSTRVQKIESAMAAAKKKAEANAAGNGMRKKRALISL